MNLNNYYKHSINKSIYFLKKFNKKRSNFDAKIFYLYINEEIFNLIFHINNLFLIKSKRELTSWLKTHLHNTFDMIDLNGINHYLDLILKLYKERSLNMKQSMLLPS